MKEIWKDIKNYEGKYQVSNVGRVKSLERTSWNGKVMIVNKERILKPRGRKDGTGYLSVMLSDGSSIQKNFEIHILVWDNFSDVQRDRYKNHVDHSDNNRFNNCFSNLQLLTVRKNVAKAMLFKRKKTSKYIGVRLHDNRWEANIYYNKKRIYLGCYKTEEEAHEAYENYLKENIK